MKRNREDQRGLKLALAILLGILFIFLGCGRLVAPTASSDVTNTNGDLWNPQSGDEIVTGREVPLLNPGYWDFCGGFQVNPSDNTANAWIGPEGGELALGYHRLVVPAGAVDRATMFTLTYASRTGVATACAPSCTFNVPVLLTLSYRGTQYDNGLDPSNLQIYYMPEHGEVEAEPSTVNLDDMSVTGSIGHFSRYILG